MNKILYLSGTMDEEMIEKLIQASNSNEGGVLTIYLTSTGGISYISDMLTDIVNSQPSIFALVAAGEISSAAFNFFMKARCHREVLPGTYGMFHLTRIKVDVADGGMGYYEEDKFHLKEFSRPKKDALEWCESIGMNAEEIENVANTNEQYFGRERLEYFLQVQKDQRQEEMSKFGDDGLPF